MTCLRFLGAVSCAALLLASAPANGQTAPAPWRTEATSVGSTARVLIIGAHPDDEDNALTAWLSLGQHVETAYLSLTRGENGVNLLVHERETLLGMVRTAETLEERKRDGAHQYFTRAYDLGHAKNDSVLYSVWPRDSLLVDVVSVMRAFRPQIVITLFTGDTTDRDAQHQVAGAIARAAYSLSGDTTRLPASRTSRLGAWPIAALYQLVDTASGPNLVRIDVGGIDRDRQRSYAEIGAEIRQLQRTQPPPRAPRLGQTLRSLRLDSLANQSSLSSPAVQGSGLFATADTGWTRFAGAALPDSARTLVDSIAGLAPNLGVRLAEASDDVAAARIGRVLDLATRARAAIGCPEPTAATCRGLLGDLAQSLATTRDRAARAYVDANGVVVDATAERETVAQDDSVGVTVTVFNGGRVPVAVSRVTAEAEGAAGFGGWSDSVVAPGAVAHWTGQIRAHGVTYPWWLTGGLIRGTWLYDVRVNPSIRPTLTGEDRYSASAGRVEMRIGGVPVNVVIAPIVARDEISLRGDTRRPLASVPRLSVLVERSREYARATLPFERLERAWIGSATGREDTVEVTAHLPAGITTDSARRKLVLPPYTGRNVFFRLKGTMKPGEDAFSVGVTPPTATKPAAGPRPFGPVSLDVTKGFISFEYPHIPTQRLPAGAVDSVQAVDFKQPPELRVAFIRAERNDQIDSRITELGIQIYPIEPATLGVTDLSPYNAILIAPRAYAQVEALPVNTAAVRGFAERGGTVVVMYGRDELLLPGVLPYPVRFDSTAAITALDAEAPVRVLTPHSPLMDWPNRIVASDFDEWVGTRARELPRSYDAHYKPAIELRTDTGVPSDAAILSTRVGKGMFIYTALSLDQQLVPARAPKIARLLVNLLSASQAPKR